MRVTGIDSVFRSYRSLFFAFQRKTLRGVANFGVVQLHGISLVISIRYREHNSIAGRVYVGTAECLGINLVDHFLLLRVDHCHCIFLFRAPFAKSAGNYRFEVNCRRMCSDLVCGAQSQREPRCRKHKNEKNKIFYPDYSWS